MVLCSKASLILYFSFHLYVLTMLTCRPDDANSLSQASAALSPLPFLFSLKCKKEETHVHIEFHRKRLQTKISFSFSVLLIIYFRLQFYLLVLWLSSMYSNIPIFWLYNIIRKTWKVMNQTKMEGGIERHLPKTDDYVIGSASEHH